MTHKGVENTHALPTVNFLSRNRICVWVSDRVSAPSSVLLHSCSWSVLLPLLPLWISFYPLPPSPNYQPLTIITPPPTQPPSQSNICFFTPQYPNYTQLNISFNKICPFNLPCPKTPHLFKLCLFNTNTDLTLPSLYPAPFSQFKSAHWLCSLLPCSSPG